MKGLIYCLLIVLIIIFIGIATKKKKRKIDLDSIKLAPELKEKYIVLQHKYGSPYLLINEFDGFVVWHKKNMDIILKEEKDKKIHFIINSKKANLLEDVIINDVKMVVDYDNSQIHLSSNDLQDILNTIKTLKSNKFI